MNETLEGARQSRALLHQAVRALINKRGISQMEFTAELKKDKSFLSSGLFNPSNAGSGIKYPMWSNLIPKIFSGFKKSWMKPVSLTRGSHHLIFTDAGVAFLEDVVAGKAPIKEKKATKKRAKRRVSSQPKVIKDTKLDIFFELVKIKNTYPELMQRLVVISDELEDNNYSLGEMLRRFDEQLQG